MKEIEGKLHMHCYVCLLEKGCDLYPALAICQRCGAGMCKMHLFEMITTSVVGMGGSPKNVLICSRCFASAENQTRNITKGRVSGRNNKPHKTLGQGWWSRLWRRRTEELPTPDEAIASVERYLYDQGRKGQQS
jgi:hypothetical protein